MCGPAAGQRAPRIDEYRRLVNAVAHDGNESLAAELAGNNTPVYYVNGIIYPVRGF